MESTDFWFRKKSQKTRSKQVGPGRKAGVPQLWEPRTKGKYTIGDPNGGLTRQRVEKCRKNKEGRTIGRRTIGKKKSEGVGNGHVRVGLDWRKQEREFPGFDY